MTKNSALEFVATENGHLTATMKKFWLKNGFLVLQNFVTKNDCEKLRQEALRLVSNFASCYNPTIFSTTNRQQDKDSYFLNSGNKIRFFFEEKAFDHKGVLKYEKAYAMNKIGHALHDLNPVFHKFSRTKTLQNLCADLGFLRPLLLQSMYIFKQPYIGEKIKMHQDATFLYTDPISVVGFWFALEDATLENGCLQVLPKAHKGSLKSRFCWRKGKATMDVFDTSPWPSDFIPLPVSQGTLVVFHGLLPHMSSPNTSSKSRHAYTLHIVDAKANYPSDNWLQRPSDMPFLGF